MECLYLCGGMSLYLCGGMTLYLCGEQKNGVGCVPLELLHQFISLRQAFHGAIQSHDFVALLHTTHSMPVTHNTLRLCLSHTTHPVPVTHNTLCACHTQHTLCLSHTTHSVPVTHSDSACHTQQTQGLCTQCCSCLTIYACAHTYTHAHTHSHSVPVSHNRLRVSARNAALASLYESRHTHSV